MVDTERTSMQRVVKVRKEGGSNVLTVGSVVPDGWELVRIVNEDCQPEKWVRLRLEKVA